MSITYKAVRGYTFSRGGGAVFLVLPVNNFYIKH